MNKTATFLSCIILILYAQSIVSMNNKIITYKWKLDIYLTDGPERIKDQQKQFLEFLEENRKRLETQHPNLEYVALMMTVDSSPYIGTISFVKKPKRVRFRGLSPERSDDDIEGATNPEGTNGEKNTYVPLIEHVMQKLAQ